MYYLSILFIMYYLTIIQYYKISYVWWLVYGDIYHVLFINIGDSYPCHLQTLLFYFLPYLMTLVFIDPKCSTFVLKKANICQRATYRVGNLSLYFLLFFNFSYHRVSKVGIHFLSFSNYIFYLFFLKKNIMEN